MKKILFIITGLGFGGAEKMLINLVNGFDKEKIVPFVAVLSPKLEMISDLDQKIPIKQFLRKSKYDLSISIELQKFIIDNEIKTIVAFGFFEFFFIRLATIFMKNICIYISIHNTKIDKRKERFLNWCYARMLSGKELFISVCKNQAAFWAKKYRIPKDKFYNIYNGIDTNYFSPKFSEKEKNLFRKEINLEENCKIILMVASFSNHKNHEDAFKAFEILIMNSPELDFKLLLVGTGSEERITQLKVLSEQLNLKNHILFLGAHLDVRPYYEISDVFTLTSSSVETFSVAALEAMAMGLPCVLTNIGGASEMIMNGINGYLVEPGNPYEIYRGWKKTLKNIENMDKNLIINFIKDNFEFKRCLHRYQQLFIFGIKEVD